MRIEIDNQIELTDEESALLDMHSFLNVMNVLRAELLLLKWQIEEAQPSADGLLERSLDSCEEIRGALSDFSQVRLYARDIDVYEGRIRGEISEALQHAPGVADRPEVQQGLGNIDGLFEVLKVRVREILSRLDAPEAWEAHDIKGIEMDLVQVLKAMEKGSRGRYRIVFSTAEHGEKAYLVELRIESTTDRVIRMPLVLKDVLRDLVANARKYTEPGGIIQAELIEDGECLRLNVADTGRGIPPGELEHVVEYGWRGSNVRAKRSMGGGFGLTKAYLVARQLEGQMWIDSDLGRGTNVEIMVPCPESVGEERAASAVVG